MFLFSDLIKRDDQQLLNNLRSYGLHLEFNDKNKKLIIKDGLGQNTNSIHSDSQRNRNSKRTAKS